MGALPSSPLLYRRAAKERGLGHGFGQELAQSRGHEQASQERPKRRGEERIGLKHNNEARDATDCRDHVSSKFKISGNFDSRPGSFVVQLRELNNSL